MHPIQYEVISGACSGSEGNCESGVLCTMDTCQYYISIIGHQDQVISSEYVQFVPRQVDYDILKCAFPTTDSMRLVEVAEAFNAYKDEFEINTPLRIAHFLGQISYDMTRVSGGGVYPLEALRENCSYSAKNIICGLITPHRRGMLFEGFESADSSGCINVTYSSDSIFTIGSGRPVPPNNPPFPYLSRLEIAKAWAWGAPNIDTLVLDTISTWQQICGLNISSSWNQGLLRIKDRYVSNSRSSCEFFDVGYSCRNENLGSASRDGSAFAGVGFIHLTGKGNVQEVADSISVNIDLPQRIRDLDLLGVDNQLIGSNVEIAMITALQYWNNNMINDEINGTTVSADSDAVSREVNPNAGKTFDARESSSQGVFNCINGTN